jgi:hypothetical protein
MLYYWRTRGESVLQKHFFGIDKRSGRNVVGRLHQTELAFFSWNVGFRKRTICAASSSPHVPKQGSEVRHIHDWPLLEWA